MGAWGTGIYQNDISEDVKDDYMSKLMAGKSDEEALQEILQEYSEEIQDSDDVYNVYYGLADILWKKGRLTDEIKNKALELMAREEQFEIWKEEGFEKSRKKALEKLEEKLKSEMPARKKVTIHKPHVTGWKAGEVYSFQIKSEIEGYEKYVGWYAVFYIDKIIQEDWYVKGVPDEVAEAYFFLVENEPKDVSVLEYATPICFLLSENMGNQYRADILETSKRARPDDLKLIGNMETFDYPPNEYHQKRIMSWNLYERDILWGYNKQLKLEGKI